MHQPQNPAALQRGETKGLQPRPELQDPGKTSQQHRCFRFEDLGLRAWTGSLGLVFWTLRAYQGACEKQGLMLECFSACAVEAQILNSQFTPVYCKATVAYRPSNKPEAWILFPASGASAMSREVGDGLSVGTNTPTSWRCFQALQVVKGFGVTSSSTPKRLAPRHC